MYVSLCQYKNLHYVKFKGMNKFTVRFKVFTAVTMTANVILSSPNLVTLMMEQIWSS
jgi:hypothetical protein